MAAILRGAAMAVIVDHALVAAGSLRTNVGKRGAPSSISDVLIAELAVARDARHMSYLELEGYVQKTAGGLCSITAPQLCRRINALEIRKAGGVLRVGEFDMLVREKGGIPKAGARSGRRARQAQGQASVSGGLEGWGGPVHKVHGRVRVLDTRRTLGGHVVARKWENAVKEVARKVAIYNALLAAAGA